MMTAAIFIPNIISLPSGINEKSKGPLITSLKLRFRRWMLKFMKSIKYPLNTIPKLGKILVSIAIEWL